MSQCWNGASSSGCVVFCYIRRGYVFTSLSVSLCARLLKKLPTNFDEFFGGVERGPRTNRSDFGGDPATASKNPLKNSWICTAIGIFKGFLDEFFLHEWGMPVQGTTD